MDKLIDLNSYPVNIVLKSLLKDKTTKENILFGTNVYSVSNTFINEKSQITISVLKAIGDNAIQPRVSKSQAEQSERTRKKAEVFTPSWICNKMNNSCDDTWFFKKGVFNIEKDQTWELNTNKIPFSTEKEWKKYVDSTRLEITCGEAPYLVSRYDASTGEIIPVQNRIGILDRKLRVVGENTTTRKEWLQWTYRAFQSVYGYEFQGDNLLIARINLLITFVDYMMARWEKKPSEEELKKVTNIIVWNIWQMDGITGTVPYGEPETAYEQLDLFTYQEEISKKRNINCRIYDWRSNESISYQSMKERSTR